MWNKHLFRIYIDTSVIGGYYDTEFAEWSKKLINEFRAGDKVAVISDITMEELEEAPGEVREIIGSIPGEKYNGVNLKYGYQTLEIRSPREVLDEE